VKKSSRTETATAKLKTASPPLPNSASSQNGKEKVRMLVEKIVFEKS
jgi:hypothetical protein